MDIYVGNLPYTVRETDLYSLFGDFGDIQSAKIITDRETGQSKGFGFVTLADQSRVNEAVEALNGSDYQGRPLKVSPSEPRPAMSGGSGGGFRSGGEGYQGSSRKSDDYQGDGGKRNGGW